MLPLLLLLTMLMMIIIHVLLKFTKTQKRRQQLLNKSSYRSTIVAHSKSCPFAANTTIKPDSITTAYYNNDIWLGMFQLTSGPVLSDVAVTFLSSIVP